MTNETLHIYVGFDQAETIAYHVLCQSILEKSSKPVAFHPIKISMLDGIYARERDPKQSNEFSFTRFLVPYLQEYKGWALFMDLDMLVAVDINELFELRDESKAVMVVKHDYTPKTETKYMGAIQYPYPRKNWSSVMLWNCGHVLNKIVTPNFINEESAMTLHRFMWLRDENIGELPVQWNWLVGEYDSKDIPGSGVKNYHWTIVGPWFYKHARACEHGGVWADTMARMTSKDNWTIPDDEKT